MQKVAYTCPMNNNKQTNEAGFILVNRLSQAGYNFYIDSNQSIIEVDISASRIVSIELPVEELIIDGIPQGMGETKAFDWNGECIASHASPALAFRNFHKWAIEQSV